MLGLCDPSNLPFEYSFYPPRSDALFSNYFEDLFVINDSGGQVRKVTQQHDYYGNEN